MAATLVAKGEGKAGSKSGGKSAGKPNCKGTGSGKYDKKPGDPKSTRVPPDVCPQPHSHAQGPGVGPRSCHRVLFSVRVQLRVLISGLITGHTISMGCNGNTIIVSSAAAVVDTRLPCHCDTTEAHQPASEVTDRLSPPSQVLIFPTSIRCCTSSHATLMKPFLDQEQQFTNYQV